VTSAKNGIGFAAAAAKHEDSLLGEQVGQAAARSRREKDVHDGHSKREKKGSAAKIFKRGAG